MLRGGVCPAGTAEVELIAVRVERCLSRQLHDRVQQVGVVDEPVPIAQCQHSVRQVHVLILGVRVGVRLEDALLPFEQSIKQNPDVVPVEEVQFARRLNHSLRGAPVTVHQHHPSEHDNSKTRS